MAEIVLAAATVHTPLLILPPEDWEDFAKRDPKSTELVFPPDGLAMSYDEALATVVPEEVRNKPLTLDVFRAQHAVAQTSLDELKKSLEDADPDVVLIISDDQDEWWYDDNMPAFSVYWGETAPMIPRPAPAGGTERERELLQKVNDGYTSHRFDVPVDAALARHLIESLMAADFDMAQMKYVAPTYQGSVGRRYPKAGGGELDVVRQVPERPVGLPHGYSFIVERLLGDVAASILPIMQNTCYPPNQVTPRRCFALGQAIRSALDAWDPDVKVAVVASGGLSHFVVDEEIDRAVLDALVADDAERLRTLPQHRLLSATSEILNWVTLGGIVHGGGFRPEVLAYEPVYRTPAGTGAGVGFMRWQRMA